MRKATPILCMESRGAAKHHSMLRTYYVPSAKNDGPQGFGSAKVVKPCSGNVCWSSCGSNDRMKIFASKFYGGCGDGS